MNKDTVGVAIGFLWLGLISTIGEKNMTHCHCYHGTLRGHCALRGHCTTRGVGYMGLTKNEKNLLNQVSKELNKASKMHKSQADRIRSLGFAPKPKNLVRNYEPSNQEMSWFKGRVKTLHNNLHSEKKQAPPGYHYMPDGSLMANSEHNLGSA